MLAAEAFACSSSGDSQEQPPPPDPPAVEDTDASVPPPPPPPPPKDAGVDAPKPPQAYPTVDSRGGKVVNNPWIVPITFKGDTFAPTIEDFVTKLAASSYWTQVTSEYGVGALMVKTPIEIDETPASLDDTAVQSWLQDKFANDPRFGQPFDDTLYAIFYPRGVTVTLQGKPSCASFGGYHNETIVKSVPVAYSIIPHCGGGFAQYDLDLVTSAQSHETVEWATDPFPFSTPAYSRTDDDHFIWQQALFGELGDMCFTGGPDIDVRPADLAGYLVQRTWSNTQSLAGHDPCIPHVSSAEPFFTAIPELPDTFATYDPIDLHDITTPSVRVPLGKSRTIDVKLRSDAPTSGPWSVRVVDLAQIEPGAPAQQSPSGTPNFTFALDKTSGSGGDVLKLTITSVAAPRRNYDGFVLISTLGSNVHVWPALITNN